MSEIGIIHDPFTGKNGEISERLTDRLRGKYAIGPMLANGEPEFGWTAHETAPIMHEAAGRLEALTAERDALKAENEHIRERDIGLIEELIDALTELHEAADCNDLKRSARINELRRDLDMSR